MPNIGKIIEKMQNQPSNISFDEIEKVLMHIGYVFERQKGSHCIFRNREGKMLTIPRHIPIKAVYVKLVLRLLKEQK